MLRPMKTILVTGDLVWEAHIARLPWAAKGYHQPHCQTQLKNRYGGAWYLRDVIESALHAENHQMDAYVAKLEAELKAAGEKKNPPTSRDDLALMGSRLERARNQASERKLRLAASLLEPKRAGHEMIEENKGPGGIAKGCSVWEWFDGDEKSGKAKLDKKGEVAFKWPGGEPPLPGAWRIKEFLGCQEPVWSHKPENGGRLCQEMFNQKPSRPDVLVIDDLGLGFALNEAAWPACLNGDPRHGPEAIFVKSSLLICQQIPKGSLWEKLLSAGWAGRVTVVVSAAALREAGARLGRGFSWDQSIEEVRRAFEEDGVCWPLRFCRRVVVVFGRSGAAVFGRDAQSPKDGKGMAELTFERFVFDPAHLEHTWADKSRGDTFGTTSVVTAALVVRELDRVSLAGRQSFAASTHIAISRGLAVARELHHRGGGNDPAVINVGSVDRKKGRTSIEDAAFISVIESAPERRFASAYNRNLLDKRELPGSAGREKPTLLTDAVGNGADFLTVAAQEIVRFGWKRMLKSVPHLECGKFFTVDREEIERLNSVRRLILDYQDNKEDTRPLSIAVFGQPGSGKSFAIKQLAEALFGKTKAVLEFNLSQFEGRDALHEAFHQVRDKSVQGQLPFVFWDEFDSALGVKLGWLKEFLAPMQDSKFVANGIEHPFGKCVFIFAGGTCAKYEDFARQAGGTDENAKSVKGPDFISRLRCFVNIKGPNRTSKTGDFVHVVRRALLLRSLIEKYHKAAIHRDTDELVIEPSVLSAFLTADRYCHGARSIESIVSLCRLRESRIFGPSELPPDEVVRLHVSEDFADIVKAQSEVRFGPEEIERLAEIMHDNWCRGKKGCSYGPVRNDDAGAGPLTHPLLRPYAELSEDQKEGNRRPARLTLLRLGLLDYDVCRSGKTVRRNSPGMVSPPELKSIIAKSEHRRWMREKLLDGMAYAPQTVDAMMLHKDLRTYAGLAHPEKKLDMAMANAIDEFFKKQGLVLVKRRSKAGKPARRKTAGGRSKAR